MKSLKAWQIVVLVLVMVGAGSGAYGVYSWVAGPDDAQALTSDTQTATARYGNLVNTISASGSLVFPVTESLTFGSPGTVEQVNAAIGESVTAGQVLADLDSTSLVPLQKAIAQARVNVAAAEDNLEKAEQPYTAEDLADAEAAIERSRQQVTDAEARSPLDIADAVYAVYKAEKTYWENLDRVSRMLITWEDVDASKRAWDRARLTLEATRRSAVKSIADAQDALAAAEDALADMKTVDPLLVDLRRLEVYSANAALAEAEKRLELTTIRAPFAGVVTSIGVEAGDAVAANTVAFVITDRDVIDVSATLDEIDAPLVNVGQKAVVSLSSLTDTEFSGTVHSIANTARTQSGVVTYALSIRITPQAGINLREGMTATADITVQEANDVLLIPNQAIGGTISIPIVNVMANGAVAPRQVALGATDGVDTEVTSGLQEGEQVVLQTTTKSNSTAQNAIQQRFGQQGFQSMPGTFSSPTGGGIIQIERLP